MPGADIRLDHSRQQRQHGRRARQLFILHHPMQMQSPVNCRRTCSISTAAATGRSPTTASSWSARRCSLSSTSWAAPAASMFAATRSTSASAAVCLGLYVSGSGCHHCIENGTQFSFWNAAWPYFVTQHQWRHANVARSVPGRRWSDQPFREGSVAEPGRLHGLELSAGTGNTALFPASGDRSRRV